MKAGKFALISNFLFSLMVFLAFFSALPAPAALGKTDLLTPEEALWLESRNNTIVVYPEKNNPPFSYTSAGGNIQGLAIDFIELIAEKIDAKIVYLLPQSRSQIVNDFKQGKGDVLVGLTETNERISEFIFTDSFVTVPTVIVTRKDSEKRKSLTLNDFNSKRVSVVSDSALEEYIYTNYPRVVVEDVTDDEVSLQQVILGEVEAAVMDIASLSFYLSKQVLSSVKVVGNTGLDYKPALALLPDKTTLQSILEKGMTQISANDRALLNDKWIAVSGEMEVESSIWDTLKNNSDVATQYTLLALILVGAAVMIAGYRYFLAGYVRRKPESLGELKKEVSELEGTNNLLAEEMKIIKEREDKLQEKIESLSK